MIAIVKTRSQAIAEIKQIVYRAINKKRYNFTMMEETSAMCDCGQTQENVNQKTETILTKK